MKLLVLALAAAIGASSAYAQTSLRSRVAKEGNLQLVVTAQYEPVSLKDLIQRSVLVVRGVVLKGTTKLSEDEASVVTDIEMQPLDVLHNVSGVSTFPQITIRQTGGQLTVSGRQVDAKEPNFPLLEVGDEYVVFLYKDKVPGRFGVVGGPQGVFEVDGDQLAHVKRSRKLWEGEPEDRTAIKRTEFDRLFQQTLTDAGK